MQVKWALEDIKYENILHFYAHMIFNDLINAAAASCVQQGNMISEISLKHLCSCFWKQVQGDVTQNLWQI